MISLLQQGKYSLIETKHDTKILFLDNRAYALIHLPTIGDIMVSSRVQHKTDCVLSAGLYKIYQVSNEPELSDHIHLELQVGEGLWQGYLLLTGLPNQLKKRGRIIPTHEVVTLPKGDLKITA